MFGLFGKKKESCGCGCGAKGCQDGASSVQGDVLVLGSGCDKCMALEEAVKKAIAQLGAEVTLGHVTDFTQIASYGVMTTPALVVKGKVVSSGKVLSVEEAVKLMEQNL
jgi:small redox-active disulfide protein 2